MVSKNYLIISSASTFRFPRPKLLSYKVYLFIEHIHSNCGSYHDLTS